MPVAKNLQMENIIDQRVGKKTRRKTYFEYLIKWKGHLIEDVSWCLYLPAASIHHLKDFHDDFNLYYEKIYPTHLIFYDYCKKLAVYIL
jgi:hypothetical protein